MRPLLSTPSTTIEIDCDRESARSLLWETTMRTTMAMALLCFAGCAQIGEHADDDGRPDSGVDGSTAATCDQMEQRTMDLTISSTAGFNNLPTGCWRLNGKLTLTSTAVTSLAKLNDLREVTTLVIESTELTRIDTMSPVEVTGAITVRYNAKLTDIGNIVPKALVPSITVDSNAVLPTLGGISKAQVVSGETWITNNSKLLSVNLGQATRLEGGVYIQDNPLVASIDLHSLTSTNHFTVRHNPLLTTLTTTAKYIHGTLTIEDNASLATLGTFGTDALIDGGLSLQGNTALLDVGGLARAAHIYPGVIINTNTRLPTTKAHDIGCCVMTNGFAVAGTSGGCQGNHWCQNQHNCYWDL